MKGIIDGEKMATIFTDCLAIGAMGISLKIIKKKKNKKDVYEWDFYTINGGASTHLYSAKNLDEVLDAIESLKVIEQEEYDI
jgi:hypothetical protein